MHVVFLIANNSSVPYFSWFAERAQRENGVRFSFVALHRERPAMLDEMPAYGCDAYWIPFDASSRSSSMLKAIPKLFRLFRKIRPDVVHTHLFDDSVPGLIAARLAGVRVRVITKQDTTFHWNYAPKGVKYDRLNNRNATHIVAVSDECKTFILEKEKADRNKIHLVHHGIPVEKLTISDEATREALRKRFSLEGKKVIGTVARLIEWKGYKRILAAAPKILEAFPEAHFLFAGEGDQKAELEQIIREKKLEDHVTFTGWIDRKEIPSLYRILDVYLHAASFEPFGFVIAEAMMNGAIVVSTPTGSALDAIRHGENGFLAEESPEAIAATVTEALRDDRKIGEAGRKTALELYNFERMFHGYLAIYTRALQDKP